jgi:hypothetical protein
MNWKKVAHSLLESAKHYTKLAKAADNPSERDSKMVIASVCTELCGALMNGLMTPEEIARDALSTESNMRAIVRNTIKEYNAR